jgi:hypothetical protein
MNWHTWRPSPSTVWDSLPDAPFGDTLARPPRARPEEPFPPTPFLAGVFWLLGALEILAGVVLCAALWPSDPKEGYVWRTAAYVPALTWIAIGVISGCLSWALALGLTYLKGIYLNTLPRAVPQAHTSRAEQGDTEPCPPAGVIAVSSGASSSPPGCPWPNGPEGRYQRPKWRHKWAF